MQQISLIKALYDIGVFQFGEFQLKSGQSSTIYLNLRKIISYPTLLRDIANAMWLLAKDQSFDLICGVPYTALPIATCLSLDHNVPMIMRRKEKKDYGTKQLIEGVFTLQQSCLIIEDVITSGASILETTTDIEASNLSINFVVALIDREQGGVKNIASKYPVATVFTITEIMHYLIDNNISTPTENQFIATYMKAKLI